MVAVTTLGVLLFSPTKVEKKKKKTKNPYQGAHSLETVEEPGHSPSPALSCREPGKMADMDNIQISPRSPLLFQSRLLRESRSLKVAQEVHRQQPEK